MSDHPYSPRLRTALVLTGTGTAGAYHAGVLQALHEAGIRIDLVAGRGMGVSSAFFAAVDGGAHLWGPRGFWRRSAVARFYHARPLVRLAAWLGVAGLIILLLPLALLLAAVVAYLAGLLATLAGFEEQGAAITARFRALLDLLFAPAALPTIAPRLMVLALVAGLAVLGLGALVAAWRGRGRRTWGAAWWKRVGAPLGPPRVVSALTRTLWNLIRGAAHVKQPTAPEVGRRYAELLTENLGQPGFRELLVTVHDLDARCDLVFGILSEPHRARFFAADAGPSGERRGAEAFDLAGVARDHLLDALAASLALPVASDAHLIRFPSEGYWRGETHRVCDRPDALVRLLQEVAAAGVEQAVVVGDAPPPELPHALSSTRTDLRGRVGEYFRAAETAAFDDAIRGAAHWLSGVFEVRPPHNPVGPFDFGGAYDERSDRWHGVAELVDRGYEDAYRQFIDPVVGAGDDRVAPRRGAGAAGPVPIP